MANVGLVVLGFWSGYVSLEPEKLRHINPDAIACVSILVGAPLFALLSVGYSVHRWKREKLARRSWDRNPLNWWGDPLQSLFIMTWIMATTAIGSALRRPTFGTIAFWTFGVYVSFAIGLLAGASSGISSLSRSNRAIYSITGVKP